MVMQSHIHVSQEGVYAMPVELKAGKAPGRDRLAKNDFKLYLNNTHLAVLTEHVMLPDVRKTANV